MASSTAVICSLPATGLSSFPGLSRSTRPRAETARCEPIRLRPGSFCAGNVARNDGVRPPPRPTLRSDRRKPSRNDTQPEKVPRPGAMPRVEIRSHRPTGQQADSSQSVKAPRLRSSAHAQSRNNELATAHEINREARGCQNAGPDHARDHHEGPRRQPKARGCGPSLDALLNLPRSWWSHVVPSLKKLPGPDPGTHACHQDFDRAGAGCREGARGSRRAPRFSVS